MSGAIVVCYPYVKSEQQKVAETRLAQMAKRCLNPDPIDSPIVAINGIRLPCRTSKVTTSHLLVNGM